MKFEIGLALCVDLKDYLPEASLQKDKSNISLWCHICTTLSGEIRPEIGMFPSLFASFFLSSYSCDKSVSINVLCCS